MDTTNWVRREAVAARRELLRAVNELRYYRACLIGTWLKPGRYQAAVDALRGPHAMEWPRAIARAKAARERLRGLAQV